MKLILYKNILEIDCVEETVEPLEQKPIIGYHIT